MVELSIALGIVLSLVVRELTGFSAAGLVVPGYLALYLMQPSRLAATFMVAFLAFAAVRFGLSRLIVLYGRRRLAVTVLCGFLLNALLEQGLGWFPGQPLDLRVIGYIVPGLIANEALSQKFLPTAAVTLLVAALVRLVLLLIMRGTG
jgi:poly-gamma-glutamate biosynthesis protein PgsC/CapC